MIKKIKYKGWHLFLADNFTENDGQGLFDAVSSNHYEVSKKLKDDQRSAVNRIKLFGEDLVLKVPKEKNKRTWIRLMTWFRKGEAHKNMWGMEKLSAKGINTTVPVMVAEKRRLGMVVDSWLVYEYLQGEPCLDKPELYPAVVAKLREMHSKNLLHGDPQIRNFISIGSDIYVIDSNPQPVKTAFDRAYEWAYLRKSAPGIESRFGKINDWWLYKVAFQYDIYERKFVRKKRALLKSMGVR